MRNQRTAPHRSVARRGRTRLLGLATGLLAMGALFMPGAAQAADTGGPSFSPSQLSTASKAVQAANVGGTAWSVDKSTGKVSVVVDDTVSKSEIGKLRSSAGALSGALNIERVNGTLEKYISGGEAIYADAGWRCSLGFNVRSGSTYYFLTAGHCTEGYPDWYNASGTYLGPTVGSSFPGNDYGIVRHATSSHPGNVYEYGGYQDITSAANPYNGQSACRSGSTTGRHCGSVTGLNYTVNYGGGDVVYGMIRTNICAEPGDSGGPLYSGSTALGLTSGGSGNCSSGGTTFYQPVVEALNAYGVSVY